MPHGDVARRRSAALAGSRLTALSLCIALQGCTPGAASGPHTTAAKTPGGGDNHGAETSAPSPPNPDGASGASAPSWDSVDPTTADEPTLKRAQAACDGRTVKSAAGSQELLGCVWLGSAQLARGEQKQALQYFRAACEAGEALGCVGEGNVLMLGGVVVTGKGVLREPAAAERAWEKACELGAKGGCWLRAQALELSGDPERAQEYRKKACDLGLVAACEGPSE